MSGTTISQTPVFVPTQISGCQLWLDAADSSSLKLIGNSVSQWNDKSGNGYNAVPRSASRLPVYKKGFNGSFLTVESTVESEFGNTLLSTMPRSNVQGTTGFSFFLVSRFFSGTVFLQYEFSGGRVISFEGTTRFDYGQPNAVFSYPAGYSASSNYILNMNLTSSSSNIGFSYNGLFLSNYSVSVVTTNVTTSLGIFGRGGDSSNVPAYGQISELIIYNKSFTTLEQQQVEGYLAWKWGLQGNLPSNHPYKFSPFLGVSIAPVPVSPALAISNPVFLPTYISSCQLWLDAADLSTFSLSGNNVLRWNDKSGNNNNTSSQTVNHPIYQTRNLNGQATVGFQSSNDVLLTTSNNFAMNTYPSLCYFIVIRPAATQPNNTYAGILSTDTPGQFGRTLAFGGGNWQQEYYSGFTNITPYTANVWTITSLQFVTTVSATLAVNGVTYAGTPTGNGNNTNGFKIGSYNNDGGGYNTFNANFDTGEILVYGANLTTAQRQQVEGYLAWKWGLQGNLPANHPYKISPFLGVPAVPNPLTPPQIKSATWVPTQISGCQLWLDAKDPTTFFTDTTATMTASLGNTIARWNDKSGNGNYLYQNTAGSRPILSKIPNGSPGVYFATNPIQLISINNNATTGNSSRTMFLLQVAPNASSITRVGTGGHTSSSPPSAFGFDNTTTAVTQLLWTPYVYTSADVTRVIQLRTFSLLYAYYDSSLSQLGGGYSFGNILSKSTTLNTTANTWYFGLRPDNAGSVESYICEFIHYNKMLNVAEVTQVEGYLAWKWGLQANLPNGHPFKLFPPSP